MSESVNSSGVYRCWLETPLGEMLAAAENQALVGLWFTGQMHFPPQNDGWIEDCRHPILVALRGWLKAYFQGPPPAPEFSLNPSGTAFQKAVWDRLLKIPNGSLTTYGWIAAEIAASRGISRMSARAVGSAIGRNPISILIPCHRVVGANGSLTGYGGGLERKRALLQLEKAAPLRTSELPRLNSVNRSPDSGIL
jgi:methylated-DNA-[protein]-cysteine S-methyltransferase